MLSRMQNNIENKIKNYQQIPVFLVIWKLGLHADAPFLSFVCLGLQSTTELSKFLTSIKCTVRTDALVH